MDRGYIKIWRKSIDNGWLREPHLWAFWCWCLAKATHKPCTVRIGRQEVALKAGQFVFGRKVAAVELNVHESRIRRMINSLKSTNNLTIKTTNKFSVITIMNWDIYQSPKNDFNHQSDHQSDQQPTNNRPTTDHKQEVKNISTKEEKSKTSSASNDAVHAQESLITKRKRKLNGKRYQSFMRFWDAFDYKKDRAQAADAWLDIPRLTNAMVDQIVAAAQIEAKNRPELISKGRTPIYAQGWITARRWEDEPYEAKEDYSWLDGGGNDSTRVQ